jgi:hypothetical protein
MTKSRRNKINITSTKKRRRNNHIHQALKVKESLSIFLEKLENFHETYVIGT